MLSLETYAFIIIILTFISGICITALHYQKLILKLRIKIIILEHNLARLENKKPKSIDTILKEPDFPNTKTF